MHILTKIFIVLTSLLSVALVPLVMLNTANEDTFKKRWLDEQAHAKVALFERDADLRMKETDLRSANDGKADLAARLQRAESDAKRFEAEIAQLRLALAGKEQEGARLTADVRVLSETSKISTQMASELNTELKNANAELTRALEESSTLINQNAKLQNENEVLVASNRRLKEDLEKSNREKADAQSRVSQFVAVVGDLPGAKPGAIRDVTSKVPADRSLSATILDVRRGASGTLAEINAGSRDGVQPGWSMTIADGGKFIGSLRITTVDVNRSVGVVELEDAAARGEVARGMRVMSRKGE